MRGGYEITWRSSVLHLRAKGHAVRVLATDHRADGVSGELDADVHRELRWYWRDHAFPRHGVRERIELERQNWETLRRHLGEFEPDAVAWWGMGGMSLGLIERVRRAGLPAVGVVGDEWLRWGLRADGWIKPLHRRPRLGALAERVTGLPGSVDLDGAATWLFNSERMREKSREAGWLLPHSRIAHPGIDDSLFVPADPRPWSWRLLYLGRLDERKGVHLAVEALESLPAQTRLVLQGTGDDAYVASLRERATAVGAADRVEFSSAPREQLGEVYAAADAVLFPVQWDEPWGLVPLEAMAVGRPVVATGTGGSREYLEHERNCLIYSPRDKPVALAAAVTRLADDDALRARLRAGGLATAPQYTETRYNEAIERALDETVRESGARATAAN
jgi:glycosyltransferase involved in cell wall biosynthesis